ncbi:MAG: hypothetical protein J6386_19035 [Candidatus Synoicihabitans palmerolidicus]|nr:hypothetical protein [Candidatus Synoicihabitans palmerolidicus]
MPICQHLCRVHWPEVDTDNSVDDSLVGAIRQEGSFTAAIARRVGGYIAAAETGGADHVLVTCSLLGPAFEALMAGDATQHDVLEVSARRELSGDVDVILLAQASVGRVVDTLTRRIVGYPFWRAHSWRLPIWPRCCEAEPQARIACLPH